MTHETVDEKARRLTDADAVVITARTQSVVFGQVTGDHDTYSTRMSTDGAFLYCSCPAFVTECSHLKALALTARRLPTKPKEKPMASYTPDDPQRPFTDDQDEISDEVVDVDPETGEILEPSESPADDSPQLPAAPGGQQPDAALLPLVDAPVTYQTLKAISRTEFVPAGLRGKPEAVLAAVLTGREMGLDPMESLRSIDVIDGRPSPNAQLLGRLIRDAGHTIEVLDSTDQAVRLRGTRKDTGETLEVDFTIDAAVRAGLLTIGEDGHPRARSSTGRPMPWELYTEDMLWARAMVRLWRRLFPDVTHLAG